MLHRLLNVAFIVGLVACVASMGMWVRSYQAADRYNGVIWHFHSILLASKQGRFIPVYFLCDGASLHWGNVTSYPVDDELSFPRGNVRQYERALGFGWMVDPILLVMRPVQRLPDGELYELFGDATSTLTGLAIIIPYWFLVLATGSLAMICQMRRPWRFTLRSLVIATTFLAVVLGMTAWLDHPWIGR
jgi:hypothetical protein